MSRVLIDTNIASFLVKGLHPALQYRARVIPRSTVLISAVTEADLRFGLQLLPAEAKLHRTLPPFLDSVEIAPWDSNCAKRFGQLAAALRLAGKELDLADAMIAAHALTLGLTLVSNDHVFAQVPGLRLEDWTQGPEQA